MVHYLFEKFLEDHQVYKLNMTYWQESVQKICPCPFHKPLKPYLNPNFGNGTPCFDGNPIFNAIFEHKAVRIIQEEPESEKVEITAWLEYIDIKAKKIPELVIALELSKESKPMADYFLKAWIVDNVNLKIMQQLIDKTLNQEATLYLDNQIMDFKVGFLLKEALSMNPSERAMMAHGLISSIEPPENVDKTWFQLAEQRLFELENKEVNPVSWEPLKPQIRDSHKKD